MKYFKAFELEFKPFISWSKWADSLEELTAMGEDDNPLILAEDLIPEFVFGVCPLKIVDGELVERTSAEMSAFKLEYYKQLFLQDQYNKLDQIESGHFTYDSFDFPMDKRSRIFYEAFDRARGTGDIKCMTVDGELYALDNTEIDAFLDQYFQRLKELSQPNV